MRSLYNRIAGENVDRITALSDGVFSVAMTLLVLDLRTPAAEAIHSEQDLLNAMLPLAPRLVTYLMSFLTLGIFWLGQQVQLDRLSRSGRDLVWIHLGFLCAVTLVPFSTALLAEHINYRVALVVYWANILLLGLPVVAVDLEGSGAGQAHPGGHAARHCRCGLPPHPHRPIAVRLRCGVVPDQHLLEHCIHRSGAAQLRRGAAVAFPPLRLYAEAIICRW
jgi:hypothetical protein